MQVEWIDKRNSKNITVLLNALAWIDKHIS